MTKFRVHLLGQIPTEFVAVVEADNARDAEVLARRQAALWPNHIDHIVGPCDFRIANVEKDQTLAEILADPSNYASDSEHG